MNWLDIILIIALASSVIAGFATGIIKSALSLAGAIIGILLAGRLYAPLAGIFPFIADTGAAKIIAFILILFIVLLIAHLIAKLLHRLMSLVSLGWLDRLLGGAFGMVTGAIFTGAGIAAWIVFFGINAAIQSSKVAGILLGYLPSVLALLPQDFDSVRSFFR